MKKNSVDLLVCPKCHKSLLFQGEIGRRVETGRMDCEGCGSTYPIQKGIPHFIETKALTGLNRKFSGLYNWFSWSYRLFSRAAFAYIGVREEEGRREITDRLDPRGGRVLEVSIGPGVNLPYLVNRDDVGEIFGLDISPGQLQRCQSYIHRKGWEVELFLGNGEQLPFRENSFDGVFHVGGINFFNNKKAAIDEMIRVARPGAKILIADETEKGARGYEKFLPGFKKSFHGRRERITAPIDLVPGAMLESCLFDAWKGWLYCIEFRKP